MRFISFENQVAARANKHRAIMNWRRLPAGRARLNLGCTALTILFVDCQIKSF